MLQEPPPATRTPSRRSPRGTRTTAGTMVTSLAVGLTVALAVLTAFAAHYGLRDGPPTRPAPAAEGAGSPGQMQLRAASPLDDTHQDQGSSIALPDGRTLWIFADTAQLESRPRFFVTSSAGLAPGTDLEFRYLTGPDGTPLEFLPRTAGERADQVPGEHYTAIWPTGATLLPDGRIVIAYAKYAVRLEPEVAFDFLAGGLFTYRYPGIGEPDQPAHRFADDLWTPADGPIASPVYRGGFVYFTRCQDFRCYSVRTTPAGLADRTSYRWWTGSGWSADVAGRAQLSFGSDVPGRNPAIAWSGSLGLFVMADTTGGIQSTQGLLWVARRPWGPWSRAAPFALPGCPASGCYTLNPHPDRSAPGSIRVSFATSGTGPHVRVVDVPIRVDAGTGSGVPRISTG